MGIASFRDRASTIDRRATLKNTWVSANKSSKLFVGTVGIFFIGISTYHSIKANRTLKLKEE